MLKTQLLIFPTSLPNFSSLCILENGAKIHLVVENGHLGRHP